MGRRGQSLTLSISDRDKAQLEALALELGMTWGDRPNISKLVEAVAKRELVIAPNHDWPQERITALNQVRTTLIDAGKMQLALVVANLLLERSEISLPLRTEIERFSQRPAPAWRLQVDRYILQQQPFQLSYQDAAERIWQFTIRYAEIATHEDRQYLDCWCEEVAQDLPELAHNRCLRLDRIFDAAIHPVPGTWREGLDTLLVELHLFRGLAFAYQSKTDCDQVNEWLEDQPQVRRVLRRTSSLFWLFREVLRYGQDCELLSPPSARERICQEVQILYQRYNSPAQSQL